MVRCRAGRPGLSLLARLMGRAQAGQDTEPAELLAEATPAAAAPAAPVPQPVSAEDPLGLFEEPAADDGWNVDVFDEPVPEPEPCGELDGPLGWSEEPATLEPEAPQSGDRAPSVSVPEPEAATPDQSLLLAEFEAPAAQPWVEPEPPAQAHPEAGSAPEPEWSPEPEEAPEPEWSPEPEQASVPEWSPEPEQASVPEWNPEPEEAPEPEWTPEPEPLPSPGAEPAPPAAAPIEALEATSMGPILEAEPAPAETEAEPAPPAEPLLAATAIPEAETLPEALPLPAEAGPGEASNDEPPTCFEAVHAANRTAATGADSFAWSAPPPRPALPPVSAWLLPALLPGVLAWLAPPLAGALAAGLAAGMGAFVKRPSRHFRQAALALAWSGLLLAVAAAAGSLVAPTSLALPGLPWTWSSALLAPGGLLGLAAVAAAGLLLPGRGAARLAALAGPGAGALAVALAGASPAASLLAGAALCAAALEGSGRLTGWRRAPQRFHLRAWSIAGAGAIAAAGLNALLTGATPPAAASVLALALLTAATGHRSLQMRAGDERRAWLIGSAALAGVASALMLLGLQAGLELPAAAALALLAPAAIQAERWRRAGAWTEPLPEPPALRSLALVSAPLLAGGVALALVAAGGPVSWTTAAGALLLLCAIAAMERHLRAPAGFALAAVALGTAAAGALLLEAGLPAAWLPAALAFGFSAPLLAGDRLPGRTRRSDWERPLLIACGLLLAGSLALCLVVPAAGFAGVLAAAIGPLPLLPHSHRAQRAAPLLLGSLPAAAALALGAWTWSLPLAAAAALAAWTCARRWRELLHGAAALAGLTTLLAVPLAVAGHWQPAAVTLLALGLLGAGDFLALRQGKSSRSRAAAGLAVCCLGAAGGITAAALAGPLLPGVLLATAIALQLADLLTSDARLSRWLRPGATLALLAGLVAALPHALVQPGRSAIFVGASSAAALLLALLRRERGPAFAAGLCAAAATALVTLAAGLDPAATPALFLAPAAAWVVAWGILESVEGRDPNAFLAGGLGLLGSAVLLQVHATGAGPAWRIAVIAVGAAMLTGGAATRHRVPTVLGGILLLIEGLVLTLDGLLLGAQQPWLLAGVLAGIVAALGAGGWQLVRRAGSVAALRMAWQGDWLRAVDEWRRWT